MSPELTLSSTDFESRAISPLQELGAYEALWDEPKTTFKTLSEKFAARPGAVPSDFVPPQKAREYAEFVQEKFRSAEITRFGVRVHGAGDYPEKLRDAAHPIELLYYQGWWDLVDSRCVAVVGTRKPSPEGIKRTRQLVRKLVKDNFTAVSGLATGVDTVVHETAIECDGRTIAVIGTPLSHSLSPRQRRIAAADRARVPSDQPGSGAALRSAGLPHEPAFLPRTQRHNVGAH